MDTLFIALFLLFLVPVCVRAFAYMYASMRTSAEVFFYFYYLVV